MASGNNISSDGIDLVEARYRQQYEGYQWQLFNAWSAWQAVVRTLGLPKERAGRLYRMPDTQINVDARTNQGRTVYSAAKVSVRGTLRTVRRARHVMRAMQRCVDEGIRLLPSAWKDIENATRAYDVDIVPDAVGTIPDREHLKCPMPPTRMEWMKAIDMDGPRAAWESYTLSAVYKLGVLRDITELLESGKNPGPRPGGDLYPLPSAGFTGGSIQL